MAQPAFAIPQIDFALLKGLAGAAQAGFSAGKEVADFFGFTAKNTTEITSVNATDTLQISSKKTRSSSRRSTMPRRAKRGYKRKRAGGRGVARIVRRMLKASERKNNEMRVEENGQVNQAVTTAGRLVDLTQGFTEGTGGEQYVGKQLRLWRLNLNIDLKGSGTVGNTESDVVRIMITYQAKDTLVIGDYPDSNAEFMPISQLADKPYYVMYDKCFVVAPRIVSTVSSTTGFHGSGDPSMVCLKLTFPLGGRELAFADDGTHLRGFCKIYVVSKFDTGADWLCRFQTWFTVK